MPDPSDTSQSTPLPPNELIEISNLVGQPDMGLAMLAEGNTSTNSNCKSGHFWVKASGMNLGSASDKSFCLVQSNGFLEAIRHFKSDLISDESVKDLLMNSKVALEHESAFASSLRPSVETFMHAWLLNLPGVHWVIHTHPEPLLSLLCLQDTAKYAKQPLFPDEIVCCGRRVCFIPYVDPGLALAKEIATEVTAFINEENELPKILWLQNHGLISLGETSSQAISGTMMSLKVAKVRLNALQTGQVLHPLTHEAIHRIHNRPDEHYRQSLLAGLK